MSNKRELIAKEETFEALKTLCFYHNVQYQVSYVDNKESFTVPVSLTKERLERLDDISIHEIKLSFKPDFTD